MASEARRGLKRMSFIMELAGFSGVGMASEARRGLKQLQSFPRVIDY